MRSLLAFLGAILILASSVTSQGTRDCFIDVAFVIDESGSIRDTNVAGEPDNWDQVIDFIQAVVRLLNIGPTATHVAAVNFGNDARVDFNFSRWTTESEVLAAIDQIEYQGGNTNTTGGLRVAREYIFSPQYGDRSDAPNVLILMTDGVPTREVEGLMPEVNRIKAMGITIIAVGVTNAVNETLLKSIVTPPPEDNYLPVTDFSKLSASIAKLIASSCQVTQPSTPSQPSSPTTTTSTTTTTTTTTPTTTTTTTTTTTPSTTTRPTLPAVTNCLNRADVVIALDASGSIEDSNFIQAKNFLSNLVVDLDIDQDTIRLGLVTFSDTPSEIFDLDRYQTRDDIRAAIATIPYSAGSTNTADCLNYIRTTLFTPSRGDRQGVPNIILVITDGGSNEQRRTLDESELCKKEGIHVITIGVGNWLNLYELNAMASYPYSANVLRANRFNDLNNLIDQLKNMICDNVDECGSNQCQNSGTCYDTINAYVCSCPSPYGGANCQQTCNAGADIVFVLDASGSIGEQNFQREVDFVTSLVLGLNSNTRVGLMMFSDTVSVRFYLKDHQSRTSLLDSISLFYAGGSTNTAAALTTLRTDAFTPAHGDRSDYPNIGIILTDGVSNDQTATLREAVSTRAQGINLVAVGIGPSPNPLELSGIASYPTTQNVFNVSDFNSFDSIRNNLLQSICNNANECNSNPCQNGGTCSNLINGFQCTCPSAYTGTRCERGCSGRVDLCLIVDSSDSIRNERFPRVIEFLASILNELEIGPDKTRVGAVKFSETASVAFQLQDYNNKQDVIAALMRIAFVGGRTNIADALQLARTQVFNGANGDRQDARNVVILISDGDANVKAAETIPNAIALRNSDAYIIAIGVGSLVNHVGLKAIASRPTDLTIFTAMSWRNLADIKDGVISAFCNAENQCNSGPSCQNGATCFDDYWFEQCQCQSEYTGQYCERRCVRNMDVALILDLSGSEEDHYDLVVEFAYQVVMGLPVNSSAARVGIVSFSTNARIDVYLDSYNTTEQLANALAFIYDEGRTNTQEAIRSTYQNIFSSNRGDRSGVPNIAIVVTDGNSNIQPENTIPEANNARARNIEMFAVAMGPSINMDEINGIASQNATNHVVYVSDSANVITAASTLLGWLCQ